MLVDKAKFKKGDIISIKLLTGEEVVGTYVSEDSASVDLDKPYRLMQTKDQSFGFAPIMITTDPAKLHSIYKTSIVIITDTFKEIKVQYDATVNTIQEPEFEEIKQKAKP